MMRGTKTVKLKLNMRCTACGHEYDFMVERDKELVHDGTRCPECHNRGVPRKGKT